MLTTTRSLFNSPNITVQTTVPRFDGNQSGWNFWYGFAPYGFNISFQASKGADVFLDIWNGNSTPTYNGVSGTLVGTRGSSTISVTCSRYRWAGAGTGTPKTLAGGGVGWISGNAFSVIGVTNCGDAQYSSGTAATASQTITDPSGLIVQSFYGGVQNLSGQYFSNTGASGGVYTINSAPAPQYAGCCTLTYAYANGNVTITNTANAGVGWSGLANVLT